MSNCPNGDPNFNRILKVLVGEPTPFKRQLIFYGVCIPIRLSLYFAIFLLRDYWPIPYIVGLASLVALINLSSSFIAGTVERQWWSKRFQAIMSLLIIIACLLVIFKKIGSIYIPALLFISLAGGVFQSIINPIC